VTSSWFFLSTLNYDARPTIHQMKNSVWVWPNYIGIHAPCYSIMLWTLSACKGRANPVAQE